MRLKCFKYVCKTGECWARYITFPFPPFVGMAAGWHTVKEVLVCQGDLDVDGKIEVILNDAETKDTQILEKEGWTR